ncbi:hypothetical protein ACFY5D_21735 [Paeniglutamicibacter sp. NPDC012692]|uniref:hypothetical protein n=1 Tax=Paeniglutamicibacter sp. NPDC012692 TaxID=3364388 RepID=UPI0036AE562D
MGYSSFSNSGYFEGDPEIIWAAFADPSISNDYAEHKTTFVPGTGFVLAAGSAWDEQHGEECEFDVVSWTITKHVPGSVMEFRGKQRGIRPRVRLGMEPDGSGYRLTESILMSPAIAGKIGASVLSWLLLATGVLAKFGDDKGQSFDLLREYLDVHPNATLSKALGEG